MAGWKFSMNDKQIDLCIQRISLGDENAFQTLYDEFHKPIFLFALSIVKDRSLAEDVVQEVFLNLLTYFDTYQLGTKPKSWIYSIARNASVAALKKYPKKLFISFDEVEEAVEANDTNDLYENNSVDGLEALSVLMPIEREIVFLYVFAGFHQPEIAKILRIPYISVRSKYGYAIKKMKRYYIFRERMSNDEK